MSAESNGSDKQNLYIYKNNLHQGQLIYTGLDSSIKS